MVFRSLGQLSRHAHFAKNLWTNSTASQNNPSQSGFFVSTKDLPRLNAQVTIRNPHGFGHGSESRNDPHNNSTRSVSGAVNAVAFSATAPLNSLDDEKDIELKSRSLRQRPRAVSTLNARPTTVSQRSGKSASVRYRRFSTSVIVCTEQDPDTKRVHQGVQTGNLRQDTQPRLELRLDEKYLEESAVIDDDDIIRIEAKSPEQNEREDQIVTEKLAKKLTGKYNSRLKDIASSFNDSNLGLHDLSPLLEEYAAMLSAKAAPNLQTYTLILQELLKAASRRFELQSDLTFSKKLRNRHGGEFLSSAKEQANILQEGRSYLILAIDLFVASNTVEQQKYKSEIYEKLLKNCINYEKVSRVEVIVNAMRKRDIIRPRHCADLIRAAGMNRNLPLALRIYEYFKKEISQSGVGQENDVMEVYSALIDAYFYNGEQVSAIRFLDQILKSKEPYSNSKLIAGESFGIVLSSVVQGFMRNGDLKEAWHWIKQIEQDESVHSISIETISSLFSKMCMTSADFIAEVFDFVACQSRSSTDPAFNDMRCDYLMYSVSKDDRQAVYKSIRESHLRGGIWDETTIVRTIKYLCSKNDFGLALETFQSQTFRLKEYWQQNNMLESSWDRMSNTTFAVANILKSHNILELRSSMILINSAFGGGRLLSNPSAADLLSVILSAVETKEYREFLNSSRTLSVDIISVLNDWIKSSAANNSLGGLSIPTNQLETLKRSYWLYVQDIMNNGILLNSDLVESISASLVLLELHQANEKWLKTMRNQQRRDIQSMKFDLSASQQIISYATTSQGFHTAFRTFQDTLIAGNVVTAEAVASLFQSAAQNAPSMFAPIYESVIQRYPPPSLSVQAWDTWVIIHRSAIEHGASLDHRLAQQAYLRLLEMGSNPDANGYSKLILYSSKNTIHDEVREARRLFEEARAKGVVPTTLMYNVRLSKLAKARKLSEALELFAEMGKLGITRTSATYGTMINACCRANDEQRALDFFSEMEQSPHYVLKVVPFNILLQFFAHTKKNREAALKIYERMRYMGVTPSSHTYKLLIDVYSGIEPIDLNAADEVLLTIQKDHQPISSQHFAALIYARGVLKKDLHAARMFYDSLLINNRVRPDKVIFQALLECYVMNNQVSKTRKVLDDMVRYNVKLDAYMANILIRGWASVGMDRSVALFDFILETNSAEPSSYESIIRAFVVHGDFENANRVLALMRSNNYPDPVILKVENMLNDLRHQRGTLTEKAILFDTTFKSDAYMRLESKEDPMNGQLAFA